MKPLTLLFSCLCLTSTSMADIFHLKDGRKLEGSVLEDLGDSLRLRIKVTRSIHDEKVIKKSEITKTESIDPSNEIFDALAKRFPMPDLQSVDSYNECITELEQFLTTYPESSHLDKVNSMLAELKLELATLERGGAKLDGKLIEPTDILNNQYEYDAAVLQQEFESLIQSKNSRSALNVFMALNRDYLHTLPQQKAKTAVLQILPNYISTIERAIQTSTSELKKRETKLANMSPALRTRTEAALRRENASYELKLKEASANGSFLLPLHKSRPDVMQSVRLKLIEFNKKIILQEKVTMLDAGQSYRNARTAILEKDPASALQYFTETQKARIPERYRLTIQEGIQELQAQLAKEKAMMLKEQSKEPAK